MHDRVRLALALLLALVAGAILSHAALAQDPDEPSPPAAADRSSPRAAFRGFVEAWNDATIPERVAREGPARTAERLEQALSTLDLSFLDGELTAEERTDRARDYARQLKQVLDFHGRIDFASLPEQFAGDRFTLETLEGPVTVGRADGVWRFTADTLLRAPDMVAGFRARGLDAYRPFSVQGWVTEHLPVLRGRALFLEHWQWLGLFGLLVVAWIAHVVVAYVVGVVVAGSLSRRHWLEAGAKAAVAASRPVGLFAAALAIRVLGSYLALPREPVDLHRWFVEMGSELLASLGVVLVCYRLADVAAARLADKAAQTGSRLDDQLVPLVRKSTKILVTVAGALFILDNLEADIWSLLTGLGVASLAVALAARDTLANVFGSVTVFLDRPFQVGDWVRIGDTEGIVEEVGFRSTRVRTFYDSLVTVPNAKLVDGAIDNMGLRRFRRFKTTIGLRYDTPAQRVEAYCAGLREIVLANPRMRHHGFHLHLNDFGPSSLDVLVYVFFEVPDWASELRERQNFMLEAIRLAERLGVGFAFPTQTLHVESTPEHPLPAPDDVPESELAATVARFGREGDLARPGGTRAFAPPGPRPPPSA